MIIYNVERMNNEQAQAMMQEGRRVLSHIPGVREVFTGQAVQEGSKYKFCWLVRFTDKAVIESYRENPDLVLFFKNLFDPYTVEKMSIDFQDSNSFSKGTTIPFSTSPGSRMHNKSVTTLN